ncbi:hypothetical protein Dda_1482 [Drechslerella dactyloides]|uniref:Uncharacterized protein n=1 Tax=Drechslerella dactyloides TaxID=74499 RepID=A0AAD6J3J4_DREDA|nr:hypothetical protein Dda_1482 [Drechslerella dactyloides]
MTSGQSETTNKPQEEEVSQLEDVVTHKVILYGDTGIGKTNILSRFTRNEYDPTQEPTDGVEFATRILPIDNTNIKAQVWDISGNAAEDSSIRAPYCRYADAVILVYDVTKPETFHNLPGRLEEVKATHTLNPNYITMVMGSKSDLDSQVPESEAKAYADSSGFLFMETSALNGQNIDQAFETILETITPNPTTIVVTATPTVFAVHSPNGDIKYVTRKGAPYIAPNKRDVIPAGPIPMVTPQPAMDRARRQAPLPPFASSCTGAPDRLSSACTCMIGYTADKSTSYRTVTQNMYTHTTNVCTISGTNTVNLREWGRGEFTDRSATFDQSTFDQITDIQQCCNICFDTVNCAAYYIDADTQKCGILTGLGSRQPQPNDRLCGNGLMEIYDPYQGDHIHGPYDLGLCAYLVYSDE